ncbi:serine protease [Microbacterium sp. VKM Ac-2923]|uniref:S1 family peptidase n=1 Tax=Microbacterium sp. VKM Ac-2923 TaxID=2929476 RepID=UPI001FB48F4A|nr:serine protease [Microbacterium sp. VKM Ac-2923]MCJ1708045.1 serine protease [Microbacterium sp. VKM Ac-2923]
MIKKYRDSPPPEEGDIFPEGPGAPSTSDGPSSEGYIDAMRGVSGRTIRLEMWWEHQRLAVGSGFIATYGGENFLVTARHNLSGRDWPSNALMSEWSVEPDRVVMKMQVAAAGVLAWSDRAVRVLGDDGAPLWYEHPTLGRGADIAVLPLEDDEQWFVDAFDIAKPDAEHEPMLSAGDDLFVVGFPRGFTPYVGLPIWTRASVASEPALDYDNRPMYLVDARTRKGHSGSPVVLRPGRGRTVRMRDGSDHTTSIDDSWVAGLYSGRVRISGENEPGQADQACAAPPETLDIGLVWKTSAILSTVSGRTRFPAEGSGPPTWEPAEDWWLPDAD